MATAFTALGGGNGFPFCLQTSNYIPGGAIILNPPSLAQTMNAYWNFKSASFGGATLDPGNQPKDLICSPDANVGDAGSGDSSPNQGGEFTVRNSRPSIYYFGGVKYYKHGIRMRFIASRESEENGGGRGSYVVVSYFSGLYTVSTPLFGYSCVDELYCPDPPPASCDVIGKSASERTESFTAVTIGGIPFVRKVFKSFGGSFYGDGVPCPARNYPSIPDVPTLTLHTY